MPPVARDFPMLRLDADKLRFPSPRLYSDARVGIQAHPASDCLERDVTPRLLGYLRRSFPRSDLTYAAAPVEIPNGWDTCTFQFQLAGTRGLPKAFRSPLVLRVYANGQGRPRLRHEFRMQRAMERQGYPVARPLLREESRDLLGGPFLIMEKVPGRTLFEMLLRKPWLSWIGAKKMAELQHPLHSLPVKASPGHAESLLERRFDDMREAMQVYDLHGL